MRTRRKKYKQALKNCRNPEHGTPYPYTREELDCIRTSRRERTKHGPYVHLRRATESIVRRNDPDTRGSYSDEEMRIASRIAKANYDAESDWGPDLIIKMFFDLDRLFFGGYLSGKVCVEWAKGCQVVGSKSDDWCYLLGITTDHEHTPCGRVRVRLNADAIILCHKVKQPYRQAWCTMLYELVHAYTLVRCGPDSSGNNGGDHDKYFRTMLHAIHRHSWYCFRLKAINDYEEKFTHNHLMSEYWTQGDRGFYGNRITHTSHSVDDHRSNDFGESVTATDTDDTKTKDDHVCRKHRRHGHSRHEPRGYGSRGHENSEWDEDRYGGQSDCDHDYC